MRGVTVPPGRGPGAGSDRRECSVTNRRIVLLGTGLLFLAGVAGCPSYNLAETPGGGKGGSSGSGGMNAGGGDEGSASTTTGPGGGNGGGHGGASGSGGGDGGHGGHGGGGHGGGGGQGGQGGADPCADVSCSGGTTCCNGVCVDLDVDPLNCGKCGNDCSKSAGSDNKFCNNGACSSDAGCVDGKTCAAGTFCCGNSCCASLGGVCCIREKALPDHLECGALGCP